VPWVFVLGYLLGVALQSLRQIRIDHRQGVGVATFAAGVALAAWGWLTFRHAHTTTVPGEVSSEMVTWGPYRYTRNPMYLGLTVAYVGEALILGHVWPLLTLPLVVAYVNWVVIPVEESKLSEVFGERYLRYRSHVRRWF